MKTPNITINVPNALKTVICVWNNRTDNQINIVRFIVLTTLLNKNKSFFFKSRPAVKTQEN